MKRIIVLGFLLLLSAGTGQVPARAAVAAPTGRWWMAANGQGRDGFDIGYDECNASMLCHDVVWISRINFEGAISAYYQNHPRDQDVPVITVIARLKSKWRRTRVHPFRSLPRAEAYDGQMWWPPSPETRDGIIRGFLACQAEEQGVRIAIPIETLIRRVSAWYGVDPKKEGSVNPKTEHDKLYTVILRAERQGAKS